jgi:alpha-1,2-mannosyltransferase
LVLFVCAWVVYGATISHGLLSLDVWSSSFGSWHLSQHGNPWIDGVRLPRLEQNPLRAQWVIESHGHTVIARSPGTILAALPAYLVMGGGSFSATPASLSAAAISAAAVTLLFLALIKHMGTRAALLCSLIFGFATPMWSVAANGMWPHTITVLGICGMAWAASTARWWAVGIFGGVTLWGRLHAALITAFLGLLVGWQRRDPRLVLRVALPGAVAMLGLCAWTRWMYGTWNPTGSYSAEVISEHASEYRFSVTNQFGLWVSPDRGILVWTPAILILLPALARSWRDLPDWSRSLVWGGLSYTVLSGALDNFTGGDVFYGYRYGLELLACVTPALALSSSRMGSVARLLIGPVVSVQLLAVGVGATRDSLWLSQTQAWHHNTFVSTVAAAGAAGWAALGLAVLIGSLAGRVLMRRALPSTRAHEQGSMAHGRQPPDSFKPLTNARR